jgi:molecular chaperone GrpE
MIENEKEKAAQSEETAEDAENSFAETEETAPADENENTEQTNEEAAEQTDDISSRLEEQLAQEKDRYLRLLAEYDNFRKRSVQEKLNAASDATAKAVMDFLSVIDNFERALNAETADENYKKGISMIFGQFNDILKKLGVEEIEALNMPFDPNLHHAVNQVEDENFGENTVCQVFQKGYKLNGKVVRCAMVAVANP